MKASKSVWRKAETQSMAFANWAELPNDLIAQIAKCVKVIEDLIAFRAVCTSWRAVFTRDNFDMLSPQLPLLMLPGKYDNYRKFYSISKHKGSLIFLPEARGRECFPSEGWLCTMKKNYYNGVIDLLNPFTRTQIQLPPLKRKINTYQPIDQAVLSASPSLTSDYALVVSYHNNYLAFWRAGDLNWTHIDTKTCDRITSIIYYKGEFYFVAYPCEIWVFDIEGPNIPQQIVDPCVAFRHLQYAGCEFYLVEVSGSLLIVARFTRRGGRETYKFKLYELDVTRGELNEINTLEESAIFLGHNGSISIDSSNLTTIKPNHIYFTDAWEGLANMKAYNLEDEKIESLYPGLKSICPLSWITPSF